MSKKDSREVADGPGKPVSIMTEVVMDPGVGFSVRNVLLFAAGDNLLGIYSCLAAAAAAGAIKISSVTGLRRFDRRLTLRIISAALLLTAAGALLNGAFLPALASALFAAGNIRIAESISGKAAGDINIFRLIFKRPDIYINGGTALACLMAGKAALWILPLVVFSTGIMLRNAWREKPEYAGRPKTVIAVATLVSAVIAFLNANVLIGISHVMGAAILFNVERLLIARKSPA